MVREHDHEEADTLLILHCHDVAKKHPFSECAPETEVFLLLIHHFRNINISKCYETIMPVEATALFPHSDWMWPDRTVQRKNQIALVETILLCGKR